MPTVGKTCGTLLLLSSLDPHIREGLYQMYDEEGIKSWILSTESSHAWTEI